MELGEFIERWRSSSAGERSNCQSFVKELCDQLGVGHPEPAGADNRRNTYVFERAVAAPNGDGTSSTRFLDLYKRDCFVLEAKQGSDGDGPRRGTAARGTGGWDRAMVAARNQAERYARALHDEGEAWPPFLVVTDVGHSIELYADFSRSGKTYLPFPDPGSYRILLEDLRAAEVRERLRALWTEPLSLDPSTRSAAVTREIAGHLALVARALEKAGHAPQSVADFLMRCLFTMFAEDVELLPKGGFTRLLSERRDNPAALAGSMETLWRAMDGGGFDSFLGAEVRAFNGGLFQDATAIRLESAQIEQLIEAARADWHEVEPAIFGTLLERALDPRERHKLGAHYTPRAYVERLVVPTVVEPLRADWEAVQAAVARLLEEGREQAARDAVRDFHRALTAVRVLDPACGSGNFLYVALEHLKRLEGEVLNTLGELGETQEDLYAVDPQQFLGIELNPRAAVIAEMVLWIGYLQWHFRTRATRRLPIPVLKKYRNIEHRDAVLAYDEVRLVRGEDGKPVTRWDGISMKTSPVTGKEVPDETKRVELYEYLKARPADWPKADFIVGNPPFIGNWRMRGELGDGYVEALRATYPQVPESVDYVIYWWHKAADLVRAGKTRRFGLITTNSLRQKFARRVLARHMDAKKPLSLLFAIPDHPWVDAADGADVRIAMTVAAAGRRDGQLLTVGNEPTGTEDAREVLLISTRGHLHADLSIGPELDSAVPLRANDGLCSRGVSLHGSGFIVTPDEAKQLGLGTVGGLERRIRPYRNGKDLTSKPRGVFVIDLFGLSEAEAMERFPAVYQWLLERVRPQRDALKGGTADSEQYARTWWLFGKTRPELRRALIGIERFVCTGETAKHRIFQFLDAPVLPDNTIVNVALCDAFHLGVLSSGTHVVWALAAGGRLGIGNDPRYNKTRCFDPFPFPDPPEPLRMRIRELGEKLDAFRKERQAAHPGLTLTGMYNVLEALRAGRPLADKERTIHEQGLVSVLKQIHDELDVAVAEAYGWPADLPDEEVLERLVALNRERAAEEAAGHVRWLRPEFQNPEGKATAGRAAELALVADEAGVAARRAWPRSLPEQVQAVREVLAEAEAPADAEAVARRFARAPRRQVGELLATLVALNQAREPVAGRFAA